MFHLRRTMVAVTVAMLAMGSAQAATKADLNKDATTALQRLTTTNASAASVASKAKAVLVFPSIVKAGLIFGGAYGEGVMIENNQTAGYYNSVSASWGLQAGAQSYGYAVYLMTDDAVKYVRETRGWEIGTGPTVVLVNEGVAKNLTSTTLKDSAYAFVFDQQGLMGSLSIEGTKISRIKTE